MFPALLQAALQRKRQREVALMGGVSRPRVDHMGPAQVPMGFTWFHYYESNDLDDSWGYRNQHFRKPLYPRGLKILLDSAKMRNIYKGPAI